MIGLFEFVRRVYDCCVDSWTDSPAAALILDLASLGDYRMAFKIARTVEDYGRRCHVDFTGHVPDEFEWVCVYCELHEVHSLLRCFDCTGWSSFMWACELADRIDSLLLTLENGRQGADLARGCRQELDGLLVLADWCEDADLPQSASEARHLHGLVRQEIGIGKPIPRFVELLEWFEPAVE